MRATRTPRPSPSSQAGRIAAIARRDVAIQLSYPFAQLMRAVRLATIIVPLYFVSQLVQDGRIDRYGGRYFDFVLIGLVVGTFATVGLLAFGRTVDEEQKTGSLEMLLGTSTPLPTILAGAFVIPVVLTILESGILLGAGAALGARLQAAGLTVTILIAIPALALMCAFGVIAAAFVILTKRGEPFTALLSAATMTLAGALFPVELLPGPLEAMARLLPPYYLLEALRDGLLMGSVSAAVGDLAVLTVFAVLLLPASLWVFKRAVGIARAGGTLGAY